MPGAAIGRITERQLPAQAGAVDLGRLDQLARDLLEERAQHPHGQRQVHRRVEDDQHRAGCSSRSSSLARIQIGRIDATTGRNFVEMKKNSTSRHFGTGRIASA